MVHEIHPERTRHKTDSTIEIDTNTGCRKTSRQGERKYESIQAIALGRASGQACTAGPGHRCPRHCAHTTRHPTCRAACRQWHDDVRKDETNKFAARPKCAWPAQDDTSERVPRAKVRGGIASPASSRHRPRAIRWRGAPVGEARGRALAAFRAPGAAPPCPRPRADQAQQQRAETRSEGLMRRWARRRVAFATTPEIRGIASVTRPALCRTASKMLCWRRRAGTTP